MIECGVCGKEFEIEEEYKDHVAQAHEAMNNIYSEVFCLKKAEEKTCPSCHGSGSVSSNGETGDCPSCDRHTLYGSKSGKYCTVCGYEDKDSSKEGSFDNIRKVDSLGESWGIIEKEKKAQLFESLGINQDRKSVV